ncbi:hypothetical protein BY996DRAFT_6409097 [Phakopsora pachyrhizi]|nr:hypothetical protein BY996DRAFT_6409097 [Phakopsora pachyrhizi]
MTCLSDVEEHVAPVDRERNKEDDPRSGGGPGGHRVCGEQLVMVGIKSQWRKTDRHWTWFGLASHLSPLNVIRLEEKNLIRASLLNQEMDKIKFKNKRQAEYGMECFDDWSLRYNARLSIKEWSVHES